MPRHPRESGGPLSVRSTTDFRYRRNDVILQMESKNFFGCVAAELRRFFASLRMTTHARLFDAFALQSPLANGLRGEKSLLSDSVGHPRSAGGEPVDLG